MEKIYDILLNYKTYPYEFYEWEKNDNILNIKSIPIIKVSDEVLFDFNNNKVIVDKVFLDRIKDQTEVYLINSEKKLNYACILYNEQLAEGFLFNDKGNLIGKSKLLYEEEDDVLKKYDKSKILNINYKIIKKDELIYFKTRKENKEEKIINYYLDKLYINNEFELLKYLFLECTDKELNDPVKIVQYLKKEIKDNNKYIIKKIFDLIKVLEK